MAEKARAKLRRGSRWQGSSEEEESDDDDDEDDEESDGLSSADWAQLEWEDAATSSTAEGPFPYHAPEQEGAGAPSEAAQVHPAHSGASERREDPAPQRPVEARPGSALPETTEAGLPAP